MAFLGWGAQIQAAGSHKVRIGTANRFSPKVVAISPSYSTTPAVSADCKVLERLIETFVSTVIAGDPAIFATRTRLSHMAPCLNRQRHPPPRAKITRVKAPEVMRPDMPLLGLDQTMLFNRP